MDLPSIQQEMLEEELVQAEMALKMHIPSQTSRNCKFNTVQIHIASNNSFLVLLTPWALRGGNPPALGTVPISGLVTGDGALAPFGCPQVWSTNRVFMSGLAFGFLQSWCCQFKLLNKTWGNIRKRKNQKSWIGWQTQLNNPFCCCENMWLKMTEVLNF